MAWQLVSELGLHESHRTESARRFPSAVCYPTYAAQAADGTYVIAEERGVEKQVPFRFECRTIRMDVDRRILFDSHELGFEDAHGCLVDDGGMAGAIALLRRTRWQLLFVAPTGDVVRTIELQNISKRLPRYVVATGRNTLLIVFYNRAYDIDVAEIDYEGQLRWYLPSHVRSIGIVGGLELTADDTILVADPFRHVICEVSRTGNVLWQFGTWDHPASDLAHCSNPSSVTRWRHGRRLVADTRNHRILSIDSSGAASPWPVEGAALCDPVYVRAIASGNVLVCDAGNACVRELDREGRWIQSTGPVWSSRHPRPLLSPPDHDG